MRWAYRFQARDLDELTIIQVGHLRLVGARSHSFFLWFVRYSAHTDNSENFANATISCPSATRIKNGIAPLPFPLRAAKEWYMKRGERVRVRGHAQF